MDGYALYNAHFMWPTSNRRTLNAAVLPGGGLPKKRRRVKETGFSKRCNICDITLRGQYEFDSHSNGNRHMKNLRKKQLEDNLEKERKSRSGTKPDARFLTINPSSMKRMCTLCNVEFSSSVIEESHVKGRRHIQNVRNSLKGGRIQKSQKKGLTDIGKCEVCDVAYTSEIMKQSHLDGRKHARNSRIKRVRPTIEQTTKKYKTNLKATKGPPFWNELKVYKILERQAEAAYEKYARVVKIDPSQGQRLYMNYLALYQAYELAFQDHASKLSMKTV